MLTINRIGPAFTRFYWLLRRMYRGITMPIAWAELAPQVPGGSDGDCSDGIFSAEIGHILFR